MARPKRTVKPAAEPAPAPDAAAEARWARLAGEEAPPAPAEAAVVEEPAGPEEAAGTRWPRVIDRDRLPIRNETKADEIARYPARMAAWEALRAVVERQKGHEAEDAAHIQVCLEPACPDEAHVAIRGVREWKRRTHHDIKHLETCIVVPIGVVPVPIETIEACPTHDIAHLLPPKPIDYVTEYCCPSRCYPAGTLDAWSECVRLPGRVRARRQMERAANKDLSKLMGISSGISATIQRTPTVHHMSEGTLWGLNHKVYDPADRPLRGE